ncbi:MAG: translation initiation factor IF-3 [Christensenellales bacterium]
MCIYAHLFLWRKGIIFKDLAINGSITDKEVRLIDEKGTQLGIMSKSEAQRIADFRNLDLVNISPTAKPPVCKIMDYGKYRFDMIKKDKESKKAQKVIEIKEIRLSQTIDVGDINTKAKHARSFLEDGNKVKVTLKMYGRQLSHPEISVEVLNGFFELVKDVGTIDKKPTTEGRAVTMMLSPLKK